MDPFLLRTQWLINCWASASHGTSRLFDWKKKKKGSGGCVTDLGKGFKVYLPFKRSQGIGGQEGGIVGHTKQKWQCWSLFEGLPFLCCTDRNTTKWAFGKGFPLHQLAHYNKTDSSFKFSNQSAEETNNVYPQDTIFLDSPPNWAASLQGIING